MVHCTVFYIRVGLAQALSNKRVAKQQSKENCETNLKVHCVIQLSLSCKAPSGSQLSISVDVILESLESLDSWIDSKILD